MKTIAEIKKEFQKLNYNKENITCDSCDYCNSCDYCISCHSCYYCDHCINCKYCDYCDSCINCKYCDYCISCHSCDNCDSCKNVVNGIYCKNLKLKDKDYNKYWLLNKEITKEEFEKYKDMMSL